MFQAEFEDRRALQKEVLARRLEALRAALAAQGLCMTEVTDVGLIGEGPRHASLSFGHMSITDRIEAQALNAEVVVRIDCRTQRTRLLFMSLMFLVFGLMGPIFDGDAHSPWITAIGVLPFAAAFVLLSILNDQLKRVGIMTQEIAKQLAG